MVLIHGTAASSRTWDALVPHLSTSHHVVRVDLPGCGQSPKSIATSYALAEQARRLAATLDQIGVTNATVVGHSSGGAVATALLEQRRDLVHSVALINTGPHMGAFVGPDSNIGPVTPEGLSDDQLRLFLSSAFGPGFAVPQALIDEARNVDFEVFAATSHAIQAYLDERALPDRLASLQTPVLVIFGAEDQRWRPESAEEYRAVPGAVIEMLPGVGHSPIIEAPERTATLLQAFTS